MTGLGVLLGALGGLVAGGLWESAKLRQHRGRLPVRIHVNGTRGKSSVTRLIAGALAEGGRATCSKISGTKASIRFPDGAEFPVYRRGRPNVIEQVRVIQEAVREGADALVVECMALQPILQALTELRFVQATHGVITNARADHLDVMGPDERAVAHALAGTVPAGTRCYTAERRHLDVFQRAADDRGTELIAVGPDEVEAVDDAIMEGFSYQEHKENVALALRVVEDLGVERAVAVRGMHAIPALEGATSEYLLELFGRELSFVDGFAANDPESSEQCWEGALERWEERGAKVMVVACRADRPDRTRQLAEALPGWSRADHYVWIGSGTLLGARRATGAGVDPTTMVCAEGISTQEVFELLLERVGERGLIVGVGNTHGAGAELARFLRNRGRPRERSARG